MATPGMTHSAPQNSTATLDQARQTVSGWLFLRIACRLTFLWMLLCNGSVMAEELPKSPLLAQRLAIGDPNLKIVCFGDSVTGIYYHTGGRRAYPEMLELALRRTFPKAAPKVINAGISGHTTRDALARIDRDVLAHKPQLVTVMFLLNDVARLSPEEYANNLRKIVDKCHAAKAEVVLCTPNGVEDTPQRPLSRIAAYLAIIRKVAEEKKTPIADCWQAYEQVKTTPDSTQGNRTFLTLMSDEIHPNMSGHKLTAETISQTLTGRKVSLTDVGPPVPALPRTVAALKSGRPLTVLAMPPFDKLIGPALAEINSGTQVKVIPWPTADRSLAEIELESKKVRGMKVDLVVIAVPPAVDASTTELYLRKYTWILNWSLSFGLQQWDCFAVPPSVYAPKLSTIEQNRDALARKLIFAQDLGMLDRQPDDTTPLPDLLTKWIRDQLQTPK